MPETIQTITLPLPLHMGSVNCYLIQAGDGFILIDTGPRNSRERLVRALESAGCKPGTLRLIVLTHGDFDHTGNAAFLRKTYAAPVAMHAADRDMLERGDMFANRKRPNVLLGWLIPVFMGFGRAERIATDCYLADGDDLSPYELDARIVAIPGHSKGSIGIATMPGYAVFFCGDLLENNEKPALNSIMDDVETARISVQKLFELGVGVVYPGHGRPFSLNQLSL